jgi:hypothetical protein
MSIQIMANVWQHSAQKSGVLLVLLAMADFANDEGLCWPYIATLAHKSRMTTRNVHLSIKKLEEDNEIERVKTGGMRDGRAVATVYRVTTVGVKNTTRGEVGFTGGVKNTTRRGEVDFTLIRQESSKEPPLILRGEKSSSLPATLLPYQSQAFVEAWNEYLTMRKEKKKPATPTSINRTFKTLTEWGEANAIESLRTSTANSWTGLFPTRRPQASHNQQPKRRLSAAEQGAL